MTYHILVVDDEPDLKHFIELVFKRKIRKKEYRFTFALNGVQALEILKEYEDISMVITDLNMPEMDGITLLKKIRGLRDVLKPVIISAYGDMTNIRAAMNMGAFDFLTKPINLNDLKITVERTLGEVTFLKQALSDREQIVAIEHELDIAHRLQSGMMPNLPIHFGPYQLEGEIRLSSGVGGDFWDIIELNDNEALLVFGDSSGHGLSSALIMSAIRHCLRALATQINDYSNFINPLNDIIYQEFGTSGRYATMMFIHLFKDKPTVRYLRAGHELLLHRRQGAFLPENWDGGLPVGLFPERTEDQWVEFELAPNDEIFIFSDGVIDGLPRKDLKIKALLEEMPDVIDTLQRQAFFDYLRDAHQWENLDDATLLALIFKP